MYTFALSAMVMSGYLRAELDRQPGHMDQLSVQVQRRSVAGMRGALADSSSRRVAFTKVSEY